jgi:uncharacterized protein YbbC (DUF1343 family)
MKTGLDLFLDGAHRKYRGMRLGVVCHPASVDLRLRHVRHRIMDSKLGLEVTCFIGPQHGIRGEKQDNMIESEDFEDPKYGIPVFSLYGKWRNPWPEMLETLDTFVIDLQDIGTRIYTFAYTMANCMRAARSAGKRVVVLDRPNPIGGVHVQGNVLEPAFASFVGQFPVATRHGMTMGELALLFNEEFGIGCELEVIRMKGWRRRSLGDEWERDWVPPSPNIPTFASALAFPGTVLFEGTNVSEGRGTTKPFEWIGAPFVDPDRLADVMNAKKLAGVYFRPIFFQPTFHKGKDQVCGGVHLHVTDRKRFDPAWAGAHLLGAIAELWPREFAWKQPPYEYEYEKLPIDIIAGTARLREDIEAGRGVGRFERASRDALSRFRKIRAKYLLYES